MILWCIHNCILSTFVKYIFINSHFYKSSWHPVKLRIFFRSWQYVWAEAYTSIRPQILNCYLPSTLFQPAMVEFVQYLKMPILVNVTWHTLAVKTLDMFFWWKFLTRFECFGIMNFLNYFFLCLKLTIYVHHQCDIIKVAAHKNNLAAIAMNYQQTLLATASVKVSESHHESTDVWWI